MKALCLFVLTLGVALAAPPYVDRWQTVADRLIETPAASYPFNWGEGVQMIGLMKIYNHTHKNAYADYVERWTALYSVKDVRELLALTDPSVRQPGYCGHWSPATAIFYLYQARQNPDHLRLADGIGNFIVNGAERSPENALGHWLGNRQLWVDTLYMACPLLSAIGKAEHKPPYIDDAANQILVFSRHLQDPDKGLFYHMWDWQTGQRTKELWGRGNGWVLMSLADTLEVMDRKHRYYGALKRIAERMVEGLRNTQDASGVWHTVLDDPSSYPESSATSMFCYGLLKLARLKVLPASVRPMALKAWAAVNEQYVKEGVVVGVSAGTEPKDRGYYKNVPLGTKTWGTGAYLMAGSEVVR